MGVPRSAMLLNTGLLLLLAAQAEEAAPAAAESAEAEDQLAPGTGHYTAPQVEGLLFAETFDGDVWSRWTLSKKEKYGGEVKIEQRKKEVLLGDVGLHLPAEAQHYGVSAALGNVGGQKDVPFVVQFEVAFQDGLSCGGSYIKLFDSDGKEKGSFDNDTPYVIMFGPDKCGGTNKVHFILRHRSPKTGVWEEKHFKNPPAVPSDMLTHLYTLVIRPDNTVDMLIDGESKASGDLLSSMEPPINPPEQVDDPEDSKPQDWVESPKMDDPESSKPDDWNDDAPARVVDETATMPSGWMEDEEQKIADPNSKRPEDWDDEEDGEWEAPMHANPACTVGCGKWEPPTITNPEYKGKWHAPKIDNPEYKGVWNPRQIANPDYFNDDTPSLLPKMDSLGIDIWTMSGGILFDNFVISSDEQKAKDFSEQSWKLRSELEKVQQKASSKGGFVDRVYEAVQGNLIAVAVTVGAILLATIWCCCCRGDGVPPPPARAEKKEKKKDQKDEDKKDEDKDVSNDVADSKDDIADHPITPPAAKDGKKKKKNGAAKDED